MRTASAASILIALLLVGCNDKKVFSARTSPSGSLVAENVLFHYGGPANGGASHLIIRSAHAKNGYDQDLGEAAPDLFLRWIDENHLEVWREGPSCAPPMPEMMGSVHITCRSYVFPSIPVDTYRRPDIATETIAVPASNVSVLFEQRSTENGRSCVLSIETEKDDPTYDSAKVEIAVGVNNCNRDIERPCAGISTRFRLSNRHGPGPQTMLTSATITDMPSYNRLPEGGDGTMIRGSSLARVQWR